MGGRQWRGERGLEERPVLQILGGWVLASASTLTAISCSTVNIIKAFNLSYFMVDLNLDLTRVNLEKDLSQVQLVTGITTNF
ncbi:hypothetical protein QTP88_021901 [Uroleucon formosanum]